jgi:cation transporter-like permease
MSVVALVLILCFLGVIGWLINAKLPIGPTFKLIINIVLIVVALIIVASAFGVWEEVRSVRVPKI